MSTEPADPRTVLAEALQAVNTIEQLWREVAGYPGIDPARSLRRRQFNEAITTLRERLTAERGYTIVASDRLERIKEREYARGWNDGLATKGKS